MRKSIRKSKNDIFVVLLSLFVVITLADVAYIQFHFSLIQKLMILTRCMLIAICLLCITGRVAHGSKLRISKYLVLVSVYLFCVLLCTILGKGGIGNWVTTFSSVFLVCCFLELFIHNEHHINTILCVWKYSLLLLVVIDLITQILYPSGLYATEAYTENWFLGYKTARVTYSFPMYVIFVYQMLKKRNKLTGMFYIISLMVVVNAYLCKATAAIGIFLAVTVLVWMIDSVYEGKMPGLKKLLRWVMDFRFVIAVYVAVFFVLVVLGNSQSFSAVLTALGKSGTLSGRTQIWQDCISCIINNPLFGVGHQPGYFYVQLCGFRGATNAHNMILTLLMSGGVIGVLLYFGIYSNACYRKGNAYTKVELIICGCLYAAFLLGVTSSAFVFSPFSFLIGWIISREKYHGKEGRQQLLNK